MKGKLAILTTPGNTCRLATHLLLAGIAASELVQEARHSHIVKPKPLPHEHEAWLPRKGAAQWKREQGPQRGKRGRR